MHAKYETYELITSYNYYLSYEILSDDMYSEYDGEQFRYDGRIIMNPGAPTTIYIKVTNTNELPLNADFELKSYDFAVTEIETEQSLTVDNIAAYNANWYGITAPKTGRYRLYFNPTSYDDNVEFSYDVYLGDDMEYSWDWSQHGYLDRVVTLSEGDKVYVKVTVNYTSGNIDSRNFKFDIEKIVSKFSKDRKLDSPLYEIRNIN